MYVCNKGNYVKLGVSMQIISSTVKCNSTQIIAQATWRKHEQYHQCGLLPVYQSSSVAESLLPRGRNVMNIVCSRSLSHVSCHRSASSFRDSEEIKYRWKVTRRNEVTNKPKTRLKIIPLNAPMLIALGQKTGRQSTGCKNRQHLV